MGPVHQGRPNFTWGCRATCWSAGWIITKSHCSFITCITQQFSRTATLVGMRKELIPALQWNYLPLNNDSGDSNKASSKQIVSVNQHHARLECEQCCRQHRKARQIRADDKLISYSKTEKKLGPRRQTVDRYAFAIKVHFWTFKNHICSHHDLISDLMKSKFNQFICVSNWT